MTEVIHKLARGAIGSFGGSILAEFWQTPLERRRHEWLLRIEKKIQSLEVRHGVSAKELFDREDFLDVFIEASASVIRTSDERKTEALENFICNAALEPDVDNAMDTICLRLLSGLSGAHLFLLQRQQECQDSMVSAVIPDYGTAAKKWQFISEDLMQMGLVGPNGPDGISPLGELLLKRLSSVE